MKRSLLASLLAITFLTYQCAQAPEGTDAEVKEAQTTETGVGKELQVDTHASHIKWIGTKITGSHNGSVKISNGKFMVEGGNITGGEFTIDMKSITVEDLEGDYKAKLENHLKNNDFFLVDSFPTASFAVTKTTPLPTDSTTHKLEGNLTIKGITKNIAFPISISQTPEGGLTANAKAIRIDRTLWNITFSGKADDAIRNEIVLDINITAN